MTIDLPGFDFERPPARAKNTKPLFEKIRQLLDKNAVSRSEYALGSQSAGLGELVIRGSRGQV